MWPFVVALLVRVRAMRPVSTVAVLLALAVVSGCGGQSAAQGPAVRPSSAVSSKATEAWMKIKAGDLRDYLAYMGRIDPALKTYGTRTMRRSAATCADIEAGWKGKKLAERVAERFSGGAATVSVADAPVVVKGIKKWVCPIL